MRDFFGAIVCSIIYNPQASSFRNIRPPPEMLSQIKLKIKLLFDSTFKQMCRIMHSGIITEQI